MNIYLLNIVNVIGQLAKRTQSQSHRSQPNNDWDQYGIKHKYELMYVLCCFCCETWTTIGGP